LFFGIEEQAAHHGLQLSVRGSRGHREKETESITRLVQNGVQGLIVFPVHGEYYNDEILRLLLRGFPVVLVDRYLKGIQVSSVGTNNVEAARMLVMHLTERGRHRIAFLSPPPERTSSIEDRRRGYTIGLRQAGVVVDPARQLLTLSSTIPGFASPDGSSQDIQRINAFLDANPDVEGFVVVEALLALLLEQVLRSRHQEQLIPSITCFDALDIPFQPVRYTHILQHERLIGSMAVDMLVAQMSKPVPTTRIDVPFTLVESTR
jgi:DNA-binding LacI/PurR family transcriptional regulator